MLNDQFQLKLFNIQINNLYEVLDFVGKENYRLEHVKNGVVDIMICTLEGDHRCNKGDYIIKGIKGEFYPCKPDIFWKNLQ